MCLNKKYPQKNIKKLPNEFTAYKVMAKRNGKYYFPIRNAKTQIKKANRVPTLDIWDRVGRDGCGKRYRPYYHSFRSIAPFRAIKKLEDEYKSNRGWVCIKIRIKRKDVTCIGAQSRYANSPYYQVIVSKAFTTGFEEIELA